MSETVGDLKQKSTLINEGTPSLYRLITTRSNLDNKIRKWTFGQQEINTQGKIILLVGQTGSGKTTLINAIVNYTLGVRFEDHVWFEITEEPENQTVDQTTSQTADVMVYEVFVQNKLSVTIIDTPGYGDTKGCEYDEMVAENLKKLFENQTGVNEIDAVCLVMKASQNRLSDKEHYIFDAVVSLFGKDVEENIVIFLTHSDGGPATNAINAIKKANIPCRKVNGNDPVHFLFNNRQAEQQEAVGPRVYRFAWEITEESLEKFFASLDNQSRKSLEMTKTVLREQIQLKACVSNLCERIEFKESKRDELTQIQKALKENQEKIRRNEHFYLNVTKTYKEKVTIEKLSWINRKATCCSVCKENCHEEGCWFAISPKWCWVMKKEHCTVCTGKCHHSNHVRENKKYVTKREDVTMTFSDLEKQYESPDESTAGISLHSDQFNVVENDLKNSKQEKKEKISIENRLLTELNKVETEKIKLVEEACTTIRKLTAVALKPDSAFIVESLDFLIPRATEAGRAEWIHELKNLRDIEPEAEARAFSVQRYCSAGFKKMTNLISGKK